MSSSVAIRALGAGLGLLLLAGSARAGESFPGFDECQNPAAVPGLVLGSIRQYGSFLFGELPEKTCNSIVKKGVSLCKAQVKAAAKCEDKTANALQSILLKQCATAPTSELRSECKTGVKQEVSAAKDDMKTEKATGLADCEGSIANDIAQDCANGLPLPK